MSNRTASIWKENGIEQWEPTRVRDITRNDTRWGEQEFQDVLVHNQKLLLLDGNHAGVHGPFIHVEKRHLPETPLRRRIPDIVHISASGDLIITEVKVSGNEELKNGEVIGQLIQYAGGLVSMSQDNFFQFFTDGEVRDIQGWEHFIEEKFSDDVPDTIELANKVLQKRIEGEIHLVIACDIVPTGLIEVVKGISGQSALGFQMSLVEVRPFINDQNPDILFVPNEIARTEIISRTTVHVSFPEDHPSPVLRFETTPVEVAEERTRRVRRQSTPDRQWDRPSFVQQVREKSGAEHVRIVTKILEWADGKELTVWGLNRPSAEIGVSYDLEGERLTLFTLFSPERQPDGLWFRMPEFMSVSPFNDEDKAREFVNSINQHPSLNLNMRPVGEVNYKSIRLDHFLNNEGSIEHIFNVLSWAIEAFRAERA